MGSFWTLKPAASKEREAVLQQLERWPTMGDAEVGNLILVIHLWVLTSENLGDG